MLGRKRRMELVAEAVVVVSKAWWAFRYVGSHGVAAAAGVKWMVVELRSRWS